MFGKHSGDFCKVLGVRYVVVLTNLAKKLPRRPPAKAREARFVDEGGVVAIFWLN